MWCFYDIYFRRIILLLRVCVRVYVCVQNFRLFNGLKCVYVRLLSFISHYISSGWPRGPSRLFCLKVDWGFFFSWRRLKWLQSSAHSPVVKRVSCSKAARAHLTSQPSLSRASAESEPSPSRIRLHPLPAVTQERLYFSSYFLLLYFLHQRIWCALTVQYRIENAGLVLFFFSLRYICFPVCLFCLLLLMNFLCIFFCVLFLFHFFFIFCKYEYAIRSLQCFPL